MSKFKVGDKVIAHRTKLSGVQGKVCTVLEVYAGTMRVESHDGYVATLYHWKFSPVVDLPSTKSALPLDSDERKHFPLFSGLLAYFPAALAQVSNHSFVGNEKHNPGLPLQHARGVSGDHADCIVRHLIDSAEHPAGSPHRVEELRALCWRGLALLQEECELTTAPAAPAATFDRVKK